MSFRPLIPLIPGFFSIHTEPLVWGRSPALSHPHSLHTDPPPPPPQLPQPPRPLPVSASCLQIPIHLPSLSLKVTTFTEFSPKLVGGLWLDTYDAWCFLGPPRRQRQCFTSTLYSFDSQGHSAVLEASPQSVNQTE